jgi:hypothetical protein
MFFIRAVEINGYEKKRQISVLAAADVIGEVITESSE